MLGAPVPTSAYGIRISVDDIEALNAAFFAIGLQKTPAEARSTGRYVFETDLRVDGVVARSATAPDGLNLSFEDAPRGILTQDLARRRASGGPLGTPADALEKFLKASGDIPR